MSKQTQSKTIPAKACCFAAEVTVGSNGDGAKTAPVKLLARTGEPVNNWYWGAIIHDMAGMTVLPRIPLDYCHDDDAVIGYANNFDTASGDLVASGALVPYTADPADKASEVIYKSQNGIPYQASIFFAGPLVIENVGEGATANVNGQQFNGPLTVVRKWTLRGIAVCPYGVDPGTSTEFKFSSAGDVQATYVTTNLEATEMPEAAQTENKETKLTEVEAGKPAVETKVEPEAKATEQSAAVEASAEGEKQPASAPVEANSMSDGQKFLTAFGTKGAVWFAQGKTFADAQSLFTAELSAECDQLKKDVAELKAQLSVKRGESQPLSFSADPKEPGPGKGVDSGLKGLARFAATIKTK